MASTGCSTFPSTVWVIHRVHHNTSNSWADTFPALSACLTHVHIHVFAVADYTDSGQAFDAHFANFTRLQLELCVVLIFGHQLNRCSSTSGQLGPFALLQFHAVETCPNRNSINGQRIACADISRRTADHFISNFQSVWVDDVALLSINILQKGDASASVRIIFDRNYFGRYTCFVALEIDNPIASTNTLAFLAVAPAVMKEAARAAAAQGAADGRRVADPGPAHRRAAVCDGAGRRGPRARLDRARRAAGAGGAGAWIPPRLRGGADLQVGAGARGQGDLRRQNSPDARHYR